ncbi:MAG: hypothetical protein K8R58_06945, partial [Bacteroidales bacterium]|nr:hypothetical protein [Bacteroidales bacterium]
LAFILPVMIFSQEAKKFGIKFSGFVKTDIFFDTRQTVDIREGHFSLYPKGEYFDINGDDINAKPSFNFLSIQTRLRGKITGPDAFGAKTSALIEGAFFGTSNGDINGFRLRHAFAKLNWTNTELLVGQYWHPLFITGCFPGTVSFNTGAPFQPFSRAPQIRLTQKLGNLKLILTALSERDFVSTGPINKSSSYLRNNVIPEINLTLQYQQKYENGNEFLTGISGGYKSLVPRIETDSLYKTDEKVSGFTSMAFLKYKFSAITFKFEGFYGQETYNLTMLGGYVVKEVTDPSKNFVEYTSINVMSFWADIHTNGKKIQGGVFAGYTQNLGADKDVIGPYYSRGDNIDYIYRVSPRIIFNSGKMRFAGEVEMTTAGYGTTNQKGEVIDIKDVTNIRFLIGVYYFF